MFRLAHTCSVVVLLGLLHLSPSRASAQASPSDQASTLIDKGIDLRVEKRDAEALELFIEAHKLSPSPRAVAQIGLAEQALGRWVDAEAHLVEALEAKNDAWIEKARPMLEDGLREVRTHLGSIQVETNVPNAEVVVNGVVVGRTPMSSPARVPASTAVVTIHAEGYVPVELKREVGAGDLVRETISLVAIREGSAPRQTDTSPTVAGTSDRPGASVGSDSFEDSSQSTWGLVVGGAGVASLAATGVLAYMATSKTSDLPQPCKDDPNQGCTSAQGDDINTARGYAGIANVTFGLGLAAVGVGTWLLLTAPDHAETSGRLRVLPTASVGYGGMQVGGSF